MMPYIVELNLLANAFQRRRSPSHVTGRSNTTAQKYGWLLSLLLFQAAYAQSAPQRPAVHPLILVKRINTRIHTGVGNILLLDRHTIVVQGILDFMKGPALYPYLKGSLGTYATEELSTADGKRIGFVTTPIPAAHVLSPDGSLLAVGTDRGGEVTLSRWLSKKMVLHCRVPSGNPSGPLAISHSGKLLVLRTGTVLTLVEVPSGRIRQTLKGFQEIVQKAVFSDNDQTLAVYDIDNHVSIWNVSLGRTRCDLKYPDLSYDFALSTSGDKVAVTGPHGVIVWDSRSGRRLYRLGWQERVPEREVPGIQTVCFSPDGRLVATGNDEGILELWDARSGQSLATASPIHQYIEALAFSPDSGFLAAGYNRRSQILLFSVGNGTTRRKL